MLPSQIASTVKVRDVKISPDGRHILYQVQPFYKSSDRFVAELWIAQTNVAQSARQLTDGRFYDKSGVFHPTKPNTVIFLSDRKLPGKETNLYSLCVDDENVEPIALFEERLQQFQISPDGKLVAFSATSSNTCSGISSTDDAKRVGDHISGYSVLFIFHFDTGEIIPLSSIRSDRHIESFTWSPDSKYLLYRLRQGRSPEAAEWEVILEKVAVNVNSSKPMSSGSFARSPSGPNFWLRSGHILSLQNYNDESILDARTLYVHTEADGVWRRESWVKKLYGTREDAVKVVDMAYGDDDPDTGMVAVEVCSGTDTRIDGVVFKKKENGDDRQADDVQILPLFHTQNDAIWFGAWDARRYSTKTGFCYVVAAVLSSGIRHESPNVWTIVSLAQANGRMVTLGSTHKGTGRTCLSRHLEWLVDEPHIPTEVIKWTAKDGTELSGLVRYPPYRLRCAGASRKLPTVMFLHGGPYRRDIPDYMPYFCNWRELLASSGYLVISPNYRGSQGRGHTFAYSANLGLGTLDWSDCEGMIDEVIARGIADPSRLGLAGWSHGGSLTAWGVTETKTRFRAAIVGAGVSNWESMVMEASSPELEAAIAGARPWVVRKESPVHKVKGVNTAVLILHGERDERVPLAQGIGLYRGLKRNNGNVEMVVYPREPHGFTERKHAEDVMNRVLDHFARWM